MPLPLPQSAQTSVVIRSLPGESMLIERIMAAFASRFYTCNPEFFCVLNLTPDKILQLQGAFDSKCSQSNGLGGVCFGDMIHMQFVITYFEHYTRSGLFPLYDCCPI